MQGMLLTNSLCPRPFMPSRAVITPHGYSLSLNYFSIR